MNELHIFLLIFNITGSIAFMISGAMAAANAGMDISGMMILSMITGVGGGTVRDLLLHRPVFWMQDNSYIYLAISAAIITFFTYQHLTKKRVRLLIIIFDAFGLLPFMATGVSLSLMAHQSALVAIVIGTITCIGGGVMRDILCNQVPIIFKEDLYITPVIVGSIVYIITNHYFNPFWGVVASAIPLLTIRFLAISLSLHAPKPKVKRN
jgi:uncharacterized membrane protein YeiH